MSSNFNQETHNKIIVDSQTHNMIGLTACHGLMAELSVGTMAIANMKSSVDLHNVDIRGRDRTLEYPAPPPASKSWTLGQTLGGRSSNNIYACDKTFNKSIIKKFFSRKPRKESKFQPKSKPFSAGNNQISYLTKNL